MQIGNYPVRLVNVTPDRVNDIHFVILVTNPERGKEYGVGLLKYSLKQDPPVITITNPRLASSVTDENKPVLTVNASAPRAVLVEYTPSQTIDSKDFFDPATGEFVIPEGAENMRTSYPRLPLLNDKHILEIDVTVKAMDECGNRGAKIVTAQLLSQERKVQLGESKYFYTTNVLYFASAVSSSGDTTRNVIVETTDPNVHPYLIPYMIFDEPVAAPGSEKNPVLWDYIDADSNSLPAGMIRITGKDYEAGKKLKAQLRSRLIFGGITYRQSLPAYVEVKGEALCPVVTLSPSSLSPADTAEVIIKGKVEDANGEHLVDYPAGQLINVRITQGLTYGVLLEVNAGRKSDTLTGAKLPIRFIAANAIDGDSVVFTVRAVPVEPTQTMTTTVNKKGEKVTSARMVYREMVYGVCEPSEADGTVTKEQFDILLGESKYYQAKKDPNNATKITFKELEKISEATTQELSNVKFTVAQEKGDKLGVYWEYRDGEGNDLQKTRKDIIRLVGRYWNSTSKYTVKLTAAAPDEERTGEMVIEVKKPAKLIKWDNITGDDVQEFKNKTENYSTTTDVFGHSLKIDELIIEIAGRTGILPQMIKAQMYCESDRTGYHFNPSYRYEPWQDFEKQNRTKKNSLYNRQPFHITATLPHGDGEAIPTDHSNLYPKGLTPLPYPSGTVPIQISEYALNNWNRYQTINVDGTITIIGEGSKDLNDLWKEAYEEFEWLTWLFGINPIEIATTVVQKEVREKYNIIAQTRKVVSYGIIQMMYATALDPGYNSAKAPEHLNEQATLMPFYENFTLKNLKSVFGKNTTTIPESQWSKGWEESWRQALVRYNKTAYSKKVIKKMRFFEPQQ